MYAQAHADVLNRGHTRTVHIAPRNGRPRPGDRATELERSKDTATVPPGYTCPTPPQPPWNRTVPAAPDKALDHLTPHLPTDVAARLATYRPQPVPDSWPRVAPLVRVGLAGYLPPTVKVVERLARIVLAHVCGCEARGVELSVPGVWAPAQVEHTLAVGVSAWSPRSRTTMAAPLRRISRNLVPLGQPLRPVQWTRNSAQAPYATDELATLVETVTTLAAPKWRGRASLLLALTAGAGLIDADLRVLRPESVLTGPGPVRVVVPDTVSRGRTVPFHRDLADLAAQAHALVLTHDPQQRRNAGPNDAGSPVLFAAHHVSSRLWEQVAWPHGARPTARRLRATWSALVLASGCGLPAYLRAAHITSIDTWYAAIDHLEELAEDTYWDQARGDTPFHVSEPPPGLGAGLVLDGNPWPSPHVPLRPTTTTAKSKGGRR